jgi:acylphosphatase
MPNQTARLHLIVQGHVQGVGFRYFVAEQARNLALNGWVRNTFKGEVEIMAEGDRQQLEIFLESVREGPQLSMVTHIRIEWLDAQGKFEHFSITYSV